MIVLPLARNIVFSPFPRAPFGVSPRPYLCVPSPPKLGGWGSEQSFPTQQPQKNNGSTVRPLAPAHIMGL